jgi:hypothetical protein
LISSVLSVQSVDTINEKAHNEEAPRNTSGHSEPFAIAMNDGVNGVICPETMEGRRHDEGQQTFDDGAMLPRPVMSQNETIRWPVYY